MILYADTSALAKLFLQEEGSEEMQAASDGADAPTSVAIAYVELRAALAAALRLGRIPQSMRASLLTDLESIWADLTVIGMSEALLRRAGDLTEQMRLRAYDAVHLAALEATGNPGEVVFACWDSALREAARALGYDILPA